MNSRLKEWDKDKLVWQVCQNPGGLSQKQMREKLLREIKWHPTGQDSSKPFPPKPPLNKQVLAMIGLIRLVEKHLFAKASEKAALKCDMCGQHKESVRPRGVITVGLKSGTVRTKFCDECAATVAK